MAISWEQGRQVAGSACPAFVPQRPFPGMPIALFWVLNPLVTSSLVAALTMLAMMAAVSPPSSAASPDLKLAATSARAQSIRMARVLVIGDSTGVGRGASARHSVAGRIAQDYPDAQLENRARDGATLKQTLEQLGAEPVEERSAVILIMAGGNDTIRFASSQTLAGHLDELLRAAVERAEHVVLLTPGNFATAPGFWWPFNRILGWRSRVATRTFDEVAARHAPAVMHVSMFLEPKNDPFARDPQRYFSEDGIHPSDDGYGLWYASLIERSALARWLR